MGLSNLFVFSTICSNVNLVDATVYSEIGFGMVRPWSGRQTDRKGRGRGYAPAFFNWGPGPYKFQESFTIMFYLHYIPHN